MIDNSPRKDPNWFIWSTWRDLEEMGSSIRAEQYRKEHYSEIVAYEKTLKGKR